MFKQIREFEFDVLDFTAYESIMLASDLAGIVSKLFKVYDSRNPVMSIISGIGDIADGETIIKLIKMITSKTLYKKKPLDLDDTFWAKKNLVVIMELCIMIVKEEYSDLLDETGLGEIMKLSEETPEVAVD
jgi:hypothetical protein